MKSLWKRVIIEECVRMGWHRVGIGMCRNWLVCGQGLTLRKDHVG